MPSKTRFWLLFAVITENAFAQRLRLDGSAASINFNNDATLWASCSPSTAAVRHINPTNLSTFDTSASFEVVLSNVAPSCAGRSRYTPCAAPDESWPKTFWCRWNATQADGREPQLLGPFAATSHEHLSASGAVLGMYSKIECPGPSYETLLRLGSVVGGTSHVLLQVLHNSSASELQLLTFEGTPGTGDVVTFELPSPSLPPPSPPPPRPPYTLTTLLPSAEIKPLTATSWTDVQGLTHSLTLTRTTVVMIHFQINAYQNSVSSTGWFAARLLLDGSEVRETVCIQQGGHLDVMATAIKELSAGTHEFRVQRYTAGSFGSDGDSRSTPGDWWSPRSLTIVQL